MKDRGDEGAQEDRMRVWRSLFGRENNKIGGVHFNRGHDF